MNSSEQIVDKASNLRADFERDINKPPQTAEDFRHIVNRYFVSPDVTEDMRLMIDSNEEIEERTAWRMSFDKEWQRSFRREAEKEFDKLKASFHLEYVHLGVLTAPMGDVLPTATKERPQEVELEEVPEPQAWPEPDGSVSRSVKAVPSWIGSKIPLVCDTHCGELVRRADAYQYRRHVHRLGQIRHHGYCVHFECSICGKELCYPVTGVMHKEGDSWICPITHPESIHPVKPSIYFGTSEDGMLDMEFNEEKLMWLGSPRFDSEDFDDVSGYYCSKCLSLIENDQVDHNHQWKVRRKDPVTGKPVRHKDSVTGKMSWEWDFVCSPSHQTVSGGWHKVYDEDRLKRNKLTGKVYDPALAIGCHAPACPICGKPASDPENPGYCSALCQETMIDRYVRAMGKADKEDGKIRPSSSLFLCPEESCGHVSPTKDGLHHHITTTHRRDPANRWIVLPVYCCPFDMTVENEGQENCQHELGKKVEHDTCVHFFCKLCGREVCYGIYD